MNRKIMIIGAGSSGRGFIAPLFLEDGEHICFVDQDERLIQKLNREKQFSVFAGEKQIERVISGYQAYGIDSKEALDYAAGADYIFVSVGKQCLSELSSFFIKLGELKSADQYKVVVCENGISPKTVLRDVLKGTGGEGIAITQGVIFCTSIPKIKGELDIISEEYRELPIDYDEELFWWNSCRFPFIKDFDLLMKRKLYTYNCLSACIAYFGYLKNDTDYGEAARDPDIYHFCINIRKDLDQVICKLTGVPLKEQMEFSERALKKFTSPVIADTIEKNGRDAVRKLGPDERLMGPLKLFICYEMDTKQLCKVIAAALYYMEMEEKCHASLSLLLELNPWLVSQAYLVETIKSYLQNIKDEKQGKENPGLWNI